MTLDFLPFLQTFSSLIISKRRRSQMDFCISGQLSVLPSCQFWPVVNFDQLSILTSWQFWPVGSQPLEELLKSDVLDPWLILILSNLKEHLLFSDLTASVNMQIKNISVKLWYVFAYLCIVCTCVFVYLCICIFVYLCIFLQWKPSCMWPPRWLTQATARGWRSPLIALILMIASVTRWYWPQRLIIFWAAGDWASFLRTHRGHNKIYTGWGNTGETQGNTWKHRETQVKQRDTQVNTGKHRETQREI